MRSLLDRSCTRRQDAFRQISQSLHVVDHFGSDRCLHKVRARALEQTDFIHSLMLVGCDSDSDGDIVAQAAVPAQRERAPSRVFG